MTCMTIKAHDANFLFAQEDKKICYAIWEPFIILLPMLQADYK